MFPENGINCPFHMNKYHFVLFSSQLKIHMKQFWLEEFILDLTEYPIRYIVATVNLAAL